MKVFKVVALVIGIIIAFFGLIALLAGDIAIAAILLVVGIALILVGKPQKAASSAKLGPSSGIDPEKKTVPEPVRLVQKEEPAADPEPEEWEEPEVEEDAVDLEPAEDLPAQRETVRVVYVQQEAPEPVEEKKPWWENLPKSEAQLRRERIAENRRAGIACCPKCGSTSLSVNKKGYSFVKGVLIGPLGGTIGMNKLKVTCLNCGNVFKPGQK